MKSLYSPYQKLRVRMEGKLWPFETKFLFSLSKTPSKNWRQIVTIRNKILYLQAFDSLVCLFACYGKNLPAAKLCLVYRIVKRILQCLSWKCHLTRSLCPQNFLPRWQIVQGPISAELRLNFNPGFLTSVLKIIKFPLRLSDLKSESTLTPKPALNNRALESK